jgi:hypothetical protein
VLPARAAYLIVEGSETGFRRAVQEASSRWGGMSEPIVPVKPGGGVDDWWRQVVGLTAADAVVNVDVLDADAAAASGQLGLELVPLAQIDAALSVEEDRLREEATRLGLQPFISKAWVRERSDAPLRQPSFTYRLDVAVRSLFVFGRRYGEVTSVDAHLHPQLHHSQVHLSGHLPRRGFALVRLSGSPFDSLPKRLDSYLDQLSDQGVLPHLLAVAALSAKLGANMHVLATTDDLPSGIIEVVEAARTAHSLKLSAMGRNDLLPT